MIAGVGLGGGKVALAVVDGDAVSGGGAGEGSCAGGVRGGKRGRGRG